MFRTLLDNAKLVRVENSAAAAQTTLESDVVDTQGFGGVTFIAVLGAVADTSVVALTGQTGEMDDGSDMADTTATVSFTSSGTDADNKIMVIDMVSPRQRYARCTLARGVANAVVDGIFAVLHAPTHMPVKTQDATVLVSTTVNDPAV